MHTPVPDSGKYLPSAIEAKWQQHWFQQADAFQAEADPTRPRYYVLEMLPYPSGQLHMGHVRNYTLGDTLARFKRAQGYNVMHPMGWDAFGLPAENAAIKRGIHPKTWTLNNISEMKALMQKFGWSYDWSKEIASCLPSYYGHQQALFLDFHAAGLVTRRESLVNWDPVDQTVLANEQVVDGKGWRSGAPVERRSLSQWFMKITDYADDLLADLDQLPGWPERVRTMQANWLGKSRGLSFDFEVQGLPSPAAGLETLRVFTTRPDTLYGATFCCVAPEHPLAALAAQTDDGVAAFIREAESMGTAQETIDRAEKKGIRTPYTVIHPLTGEALPVYVANFVLMTYGTGAIMAVPGHDERDHAFAVKYQLPIRQVIQPLDGSGPIDVQQQPYTGEGTVVDSPLINGQNVDDAKATIIAKAEAEGWGQGVTQWRLRDWGISRQRYWGCPIPFIHCETCGTVPVPRESLPVELPDDVTFTGAGNPLDLHPTWKHTTCPTCQGPAVRETDTMDTFMDSSWYYLRYLCPQAETPLDRAKVDYWTAPHGIDQYIGGIEHAVLHLLYSRFFTKALHTQGQVTTREPFANLLCQGMVIGNAYQKADGTYLYPSQVRIEGGQGFDKVTGEPITILPAEKISKSKNNGDSPEALLARYGADTLRLFILFAAPVERDLEWSETAIEGAWRFLNRVWTLSQRFAAVPAAAPEPMTDTARQVRRKVHQTIQKVTRDIEVFSYNTMVAACMELSNTLAAVPDTAETATLAEGRAGVEALVRLLNPACPHITEELWQQLGHTQPLYATSWPDADADAARSESLTLVVQVSGKLRAKLEVAPDINEAAALAAAETHPDVQPWLAGKTIAKRIYVPGRLVNLVVSG